MLSVTIGIMKFAYPVRMVSTINIRGIWVYRIITTSSTKGIDFFYLVRIRVW